MIVRVMTDNQYQLGEEHQGAIAALDDQLVRAMDANDTGAFQGALTALVALVQQNGQPLPMNQVVPSDVIVPAPDMSLAEARQRLQTVEAHQAAGDRP